MRSGFRKAFAVLACHYLVVGVCSSSRDGVGIPRVLRRGEARVRALSLCISPAPYLPAYCKGVRDTGLLTCS